MIRWELQLGIWNGDGKLDVVVADFNSLGTTFGGGVSILFGNGDGTFQPAVSYTTGVNPNGSRNRGFQWGR